jgi:hypothetical protein
LEIVVGLEHHERKRTLYTHFYRAAVDEGRLLHFLTGQSLIPAKKWHIAVGGMVVAENRLGLGVAYERAREFSRATKI